MVEHNIFTAGLIAVTILILKMYSIFHYRFKTYSGFIDKIKKETLKGHHIVKIDEDEFVFEKKILSGKDKSRTTIGDSISPLDSPIEELLRHRADKRRAKLKVFNYRFQSNYEETDTLSRLILSNERKHWVSEKEYSEITALLNYYLNVHYPEIRERIIEETSGFQSQKVDKDAK